MDIYAQMADLIPASMRKHIIEENFIDLAVNVDIVGTPMEYLFDVYEEFLDKNSEHDDWHCHKCREHILKDWRIMKPYLLRLENREA